MPCFPIVGKNNKWPIGIDGDRTVSTANEYIELSGANSKLDYRNLTINAGCTLWIGSADGTPILLGIAGNLVLNGSIRIVNSKIQTAWPLSTSKSIQRPNNLGVVSWTTHPAYGNGGNGAGQYDASISGRKELFGRGNGSGFGGGGASLAVAYSVPPGFTYGFGGDAGSDGANGKSGTAYVGIGGASSVNWGTPLAGTYSLHNGHGRNYSVGVFSETSVTGSGGGGGGFIETGANSFYPGGGSGGVPGRHGAMAFILVLGSVSGGGVISANGANGTNGSAYRAGSEMYWDPGIEEYVTADVYSGSGGGGSGGHGGRIVFRHNNVSVPISLTAGAGIGGSQGGTAPGQTDSTYYRLATNGANGTAGTTDVAHY